MKQGWVKKQLHECLEKTSSATKVKKEHVMTEGLYPVISQEQSFISGFWNRKSDLYKIQKPVVIFGDHTRIIKYVDFDFIIGADGIKILQTKEFLLPKYLYCFLIAQPVKSLGYARHFRILKDLEIVFPAERDEQKRIVKILDEAFKKIDKAIATTKKNLTNAHEFFESYLNNVFSQKGDNWEEKKLGDECLLIMGQSPSGKSYNSNGTGIPLINGPVEFGGLDPFSETLATKFTTSPTKLCKKGDLILCVRGSTTGRMNIAGQDACIGRGVAAIRSPKNQDWINRFISFSRQTIYNLGSGSTFPNVSSKELNEIIIPLPPEDERKQLIEKIEEINSETNKLETAYRYKLKALAELKQSLLKKAFEGEL